MIRHAEQMLDSLIDIEELASPAFKIEDDPRVTRVGRFLRRSSLDELPQLWNVLRGEMSLVGPRPEEMRIVKLYNEGQRSRLTMKPGITGLAQINGRNALKWSKRLEYDRYYVENYSLRMDLMVLFKTIQVIFFRKGIILDRNPESVFDLDKQHL